MIRDLVEKSRSYRAYDRSEKLTREELLELVDLTRFCPSSINQQPLKYYIVSKEEEVAAVQAQTKWAIALSELNLPFPGTEPTAFILICFDKSVHSSINVFLRDIGACAQTILLGAAEKGFGGCMIGSLNKAKIAEALHLPENLEPNLAVALGKPNEKIVLTPVGEDGKTGYYRDESGNIHYVPKRSLEEIVIG